MIHHGDCLDVMATLEPESVSAIVTDPPYGLGFMGKAWDRIKAERQGTASVLRAGGQAQFDWQPNAFQDWCAVWGREVLRVAKPGAHLLSFGGTRTVHRLTAGLEDAGWEIRDCLVWGYASGFPKSHNLSGEWDGWGTALKPAWEPIVMARKPLRGTVAVNVAAHGAGALNIDATRIPFAGEADVAFMESRIDAWSKQTGWDGPAAINVGQRKARKSDRAAAAAAAAAGFAQSRERGTASQSQSIGRESRDGTNTYDPEALTGRWPANVILTDPIFDGGIEGVVGGGETQVSAPASGPTWTGQSGSPSRSPMNGMGDRDPAFYGDSGTYSRFFLIPKADRAEREPVGGLLPVRRGSVETMDPRVRDGSGAARMPMRANVHPTVKPVDLMRHLVRLVTPPGGLVLDPFLGSGTTGIACEMEGFDWIGIEREAEYVAIAEARLVGVQRGFGLSA